MRILYLTRSDSVHDQRFMQTLVDADHDGFVLRLNPGDFPTPRGVTALKWNGIKGPLRSHQIPTLVKQLKSILEELRPDLVHAGPLHDVAYLVARTGFSPLLSMSWGFDLMKDVHTRRINEIRTRFTLAHSARLITDARCSANVAKKLGFDEGKICIFPWGVDLARFSPQSSIASGKLWREERGWQDKTVMLCLRSWEANYGVDVLVRAFSQAVQKEANLRLILLGDGSQRELIQRLIAQENLQNKVFLGGRIPNSELTTYFGAADVYVTPSHVDGSSVSLMEAMASGLPSFASDIPANREWIREGENGWLFPDGNSKILSELLVKTPALDLRAAGRQARLDAQVKADWEKNKQVLLNCYTLTFASEGRKK